MVGQDRATRHAGWSVSLRTYVTAVMLVALLPLLAHAVLTTWYSYTSARTWAERDLLSDAEHLAKDIDSRLDVSRMIMRLVASSPAAQRGDLPAVRDLMETSRAQGAIAAAVLRDPQAGVVLAVGLSEDDARRLAAAPSDQFVVTRLDGKAAMVAAWPVRSSDPRLARLDFVVAAEILPTSEGGGAGWHVSAVADRDGRIAWPEPATGNGFLPRQFRDPAAVAGVVHDWLGLEGQAQSHAFARAERSGLVVAIGQPMPTLYERVPFGPVGALAIALGVVLASAILAQAGAFQINAAYQGAVSGARPGGLRIDDATRLGTALRHTRDRLFQAAGGIAVIELSRTPGTKWRDASIVASPNLQALLGRPEDEAPTFDALVGAITADDRAALRAMLTDSAGQARVFTHLVQARRPDGVVRHINIVGMLREAVPGQDEELVLTLQDVTAQKETELELQAQASRLRLATDIAGLGVWERDVQRGGGQASERMWQIIGCVPRAELDMDTYLARVHPDDRARVADAISRIHPEEMGTADHRAVPAAQLRYRIVQPGGAVRHVRSSRIFIAGRAGAAVSAIGVLIDETEAVAAQRALAASEARFRLAVEVAELGVLERYVDPQRNVRIWNERMWRMRGLEPRPEPLGYEEMLAMVHPEDRDRVAAIMDERDTAGDGATEYEFRIRRPDGEERILQSRSVRTQHPEADAVTVVAINLDITERRRAERALAASEARFRLAVDTAELGVAVVDPVTARGMWNERLFRICGLPPGLERPSDADVLRLIHPDDRAGVAARMAAQRTRGEGSAAGIEFRIVQPSGAERTVLARSVTLRSASERATMLTVFQDVTESRAAERRVAESEARFRLAVETAELGVAERNLATGEGVWSERLFGMCGLAPRNQRLTDDEALALVHPDDRRTLAEAMARQSEGADGMVTELDFRIVRPDGQQRILHLRCMTLRRDGVAKMLSVHQDVTDQREAELALRDRTTTLELAIEAADLGIWVRDSGETARQASARLWAMFGLPDRSGMMTGEELLAGLHPDDREAVLRDWVPADGDPTPRQREFRAMWPDGTVRQIQSRRAVLRDAAGKVQRVIGVVADITEARRATEALAASEARLRLAVETAALGVFDDDPATRAGQWSERMWRMRGLEPRAGKPAFDDAMAMVHPGDREQVLARIREQETMPDGALGEMEFRVVWPDGSVHHILSRALTQRDAGGPGVRIFGTNLDVTESRRAAEALEESEARLRLAVETAEMGMFEFNLPSRSGFWSDRMWRMRGLEPRETGLTLDEVVALIHPDDRARVAADIARQTTLPHGAHTDFEYRVVWPDGSTHFIAARAITLRDRDGRFGRIFGINLDVTEARRAAQALEESEARLRLAVETAGLGLFEHDPATRTSHWSDLTWRMRGLEPREGAPTFEEGIALVHPDDRARLVAHIRHLETLPEGGMDAIEYRVVWPDGTTRHLVARTMNLPTSDGTGTRFHGINLDVTELRRAARTMEESEARLRLATEVADLGVFQLNMPEGTGYWSDRMWQTRGWAPRPGMPDPDIALAAIHPDDRERVRGMRDAFGSRPHGDIQRFTFRVVWADGSVRHLLSHNIVLRGRTAEEFLVIGVNRDITEQVEREQALREAAARYELATEAARLGVWEWDSAEQRMTWSARTWNIAGVAAHDAAPTLADRFQAIHPDDHDRVPSVWATSASAQRGEHGEGEFRLRRPDGTLRYLHWHGIPLRDPHGAVLRFTGVVADVTEARMAERALRTSEELFRMASEAAEQGVWNHDLATGEVTWTPRMWRIHGLAPAAGAPPREERIALIHPEDRGEVLRLPQELSAAPENTVQRRSYRIVRPDGAVRTLERQAMLVQGPDGQPTRIVGVVHDVTEARELSAQAMVADKLATLGEMAGAIAHELAQPLQTVMATAATARMRLGKGADPDVVQVVADRLAWIERLTERAGKTIQHLLSFSRGESAESFTHLASAVEGALELAGHGLRRAGIVLSIDVPAGLPLVRGGQIEIEQVLVNLLNNARDAIGECEVRRIAIAARSTDDAVVLDISDTGGGIPAGTMERIFEPFYTTKPLGKGTGIGLLIVRRTMRALGGGITVANGELGACFSLTFAPAIEGPDAT